MLFPWTNSKGAIVGAISGFLMSGWVSFGIQYAGASGIVVARKLPVSVEKCDEMYGINVTYIEPVSNCQKLEKFFTIYYILHFRLIQMSRMYFHCLGYLTIGLLLLEF